MLSLDVAQSKADSNLYLRSDGFLVQLYVDDISMVFPQDAAKAAIEVKSRVSVRNEITIPGRARQFVVIKIQPKENSTGISLGQKAFITTILKQFNMQNAHDVSTPVDPNVKLDLAEDVRETEVKDIKGYKAIVRSLMYAALATRPGISFSVAALS